MLIPDTFCEDRLLLFPPAVCCLLILFSRNHNVSIFSLHSAISMTESIPIQYIAAKLLEINERGVYDDPANLSGDDPASKAKLLAQE